MSHAESSIGGASCRTRPILQLRGVPLVRCPVCRSARVIELIARTPTNNGRRFFKCPLRPCNFFMWQDQYEDLIGVYTYEGGSADAIPVKAEVVDRLEKKLDRVMLFVQAIVCLVSLVVVFMLVAAGK